LKKKAVSAIKYIVLCSAGLFFLYLAFKGNDPAKLLASLRKADYTWIFISLLCTAVAHLSRAVRWNLLIEPLGYKPRLRNTFAAIMGGYLANLAVPRLGEITRCGALSQTENVPFDKLLGTVIAERIVDFLTLLLCIVLTALVEYQLLGSFLFRNIGLPVLNKLRALWDSPWLLLLIAAAVYVAVYLIIRETRSSSNKMMLKISSVIKGTAQGLKSVLKLRHKGLFLLHSVLIWFLYFLSSYLCFFALDATEGLTPSAGLFILVAGSLGMTAPVQGGLGVFHILVSQGLTLYGVSLMDGLAYATVSHTSQILLVLLLGLISVVLISVNKSVLTNEAP
jgi:glycosyltransferase 2 family protein